MQARAYDERLNGLLPERLTGFQAVNALDQYVAVLVSAHQDRLFLSLFQNFLCNRLDPLQIEFLAALNRHVNFFDLQDNGEQNICLSHDKSPDTEDLNPDQIVS